MKAFRHKKLILTKPSLAWWKVRKLLIHALGGELREESSKKAHHSYERGKVIGQAEAAVYIKHYMKSLWEDKRWEDKAYKEVSKFLDKDLPQQYKELSNS